VPFGRQTYGVEAAAEAYFGKTARKSAPPEQQLTTAEAIALLAMVDQPEPSPDDPEGSPGFDATDAVEFWDQVNREDWEVCALTQRGMQSRSFTPGRYTTQEHDVHRFDVMVAERYLQALT